MILADAAPEAGLGHVMRCSAIAVALMCRGVQAGCFAYCGTDELETDGIEWRPIASPRALAETGANRVLVVDSYRLTSADWAAITAAKLVLMHDHGPAHGADLVVDPAALEPLGENWLTGFEFACLRSHFWGLPTRLLSEEIRRVLVTTGGGDRDGRGGKLAGAAQDALPDARVRLVRGKSVATATPPGIEIVRKNPLLDELLAADVVISGGGQTMLEAAAAGTPCIALPLADNQEAQVRRLEAAGGVRAADASSMASVSDALRELSASPEHRRDMSVRSQELVDGYGALRVAFRIAQLAQKAGT